jgi:hypothetical protein
MARTPRKEKKETEQGAEPQKTPGQTNWWQTTPVILSAIAGMMTALGGLLVALNQTGYLGNSNKTIERQAALNPPLFPTGTPDNSVLPSKDEMELRRALAEQTAHWVERIFQTQAENGGIKGIPLDDETKTQSWATAQCLAAVMNSPVNLEPYVPRIKRAFAYIQSKRRTDPNAGWNLYDNDSIYTVTEINSWVTIAYIRSLAAKTPIWDDTEKEEILTRITNELEELKLRQDDSGGWRTIKETGKGFTRTYSSALALWAFLEAKRSPAVSRLIGTRYDENIRRGINWLIKNYVKDQGWTPNPNLTTRRRYEGLTAQTLFVLSRAETMPEFNYLEREPIYLNAEKAFIPDKKSIDRSIDDNSQVSDTDELWFSGTDYVNEATTFLWFPWTLAELTHLSNDKSLTPEERQQVISLRHKIVDARMTELETSIGGEAYSYAVAEYLLGASFYLEQS